MLYVLVKSINNEEVQISQDLLYMQSATFKNAVDQSSDKHISVLDLPFSVNKDELRLFSSLITPPCSTVISKENKVITYKIADFLEINWILKKYKENRLPLDRWEHNLSMYEKARRSKSMGVILQNMLSKIDKGTFHGKRKYTFRIVFQKNATIHDSIIINKATFLLFAKNPKYLESKLREHIPLEPFIDVDLPYNIIKIDYEINFMYVEE